MSRIILGLISLEKYTFRLFLGLFAEGPDSLEEVIELVWIDVYRGLEIETLLDLWEHGRVYDRAKDHEAMVRETPFI